ncbi:MAG: SDR family oxidoreductase [Nocardioides sp.]
MDLGLTGRVFLVTGGGRGLGRATADVLVAEGARVVVSGRTEESLAAAVDELGRDHASYVVADNADPKTPGRLIAEAHHRWGRLDGALISVGGPPVGRVSEISDDDWASSFQSVFLGAVRLAREVADALGEGGAIALVLSTSVRAPLSAMAVSNGLRPGLAMIAKQLADEVGPRGVRVNGLLPGRVRTERLAELDALGGDAPVIPLGRSGAPSEFGRAAAFLLSPAASFVSGAMLPVDGGMTRAL